MSNPQDPVEAWLTSQGFEKAHSTDAAQIAWWSPRDNLFLFNDQAAFFYREAKRMELKARIKQTKRFRQHEKDVLGYVRNESYYEAEIEQLEAQLQLMEERHES